MYRFKGKNWLKEQFSWILHLKIIPIIISLGKIWYGLLDNSYLQSDSPNLLKAIVLIIHSNSTKKRILICMLVEFGLQQSLICWRRWAKVRANLKNSTYLFFMFKEGLINSWIHLTHLSLSRKPGQSKSRWLSFMTYGMPYGSMISTLRWSV